MRRLLNEYTKMNIEELAEVNATAEFEVAYQHIRDLLASNFVPTIYRRLALYPAAFALAVKHLSHVVDLADSTDFVRTAQSAAYISLSGASLSEGPIKSEVTDVIERYRSANPLNLLFSISLMGADTRPNRSVMQPPLGPVQSEIQQDIFESHGAFITPGLWRDLDPWPDRKRELWMKTREIAQDGRLVNAREAVMECAALVFLGSTLEFLPAQIASLLPEPASIDFAWFPTGVATMVVEGEWLHNLTDNLSRKETK
jgi:hypothetical protein